MVQVHPQFRRQIFHGSQQKLLQLPNLKQKRRASIQHQGYQSIGSFHSDDLGQIMSCPDEEYAPPPLPFERCDQAIVTPRQRQSPKDFAQDFMLDRKKWTFLNHGAFGGAIRQGHTLSTQWREYLEEQPLRFFDRVLLPHLAYSTRRLANFCGARNSQMHREGLTLLPNATSGLNSVFKGFAQQYKSGRVILWDTSYGSVKTMARHYCESNRVTTIPLQSKYLSQLTTSTTAEHPEQILQQAMQETISQLSSQEREQPFLVVLDHTTSNTALNMPIESLTQWIKQTYGSNVIVAVDAAHGLLAQDVDLDRLYQSDIDIYISNGHKWLSCPRGVGMMYCPNQDLRDSLLATPVIVSHGSDAPDFLSRFVFDGCRDYTAALVLPTVLDYWENCFETCNVRSIMKEQLFRGIQCLSDHWFPQNIQQNEWLKARVTIAPPSMLGPMALVRLPINNSNNNKTSSDAKRIQDFLFDHSIEVPIKCINGELFVRVSCHVYNELEEFDRLGEIVLSNPEL